MSTTTECTQNSDPLKLVREGTSQEQRLSPALDPAYAPVDERTVAHRMVFAQAYSAFLKFHDTTGAEDGGWQPFFSRDPSVRLAVAAAEDVEYYRTSVKEYFDFLKNLDAHSDEGKAKERLGYLFSCAGTLARQLDVLKEGLPEEIPFRGALQNLIRSQLASHFRRLVSCYGADLLRTKRLIAEAAPPAMIILGGKSAVFGDIYRDGLSDDWITDNSPSWSAYTSAIPADDSVYGSGSAIKRINHIAGHNLFTAIFDQFLKVYARTVIEAGKELDRSLREWDRHEPHYTLFLAFLRLFEHARSEANTLTGRHLDFYYREILKLREKEAEPGKAHLVAELAKQAAQRRFEAGELFKAGKDDLGRDAFFANDRDFVANRANVAALKTVYRHDDEKVETDTHATGRIHASPVADSDDGQGAELTATDQSWHPFYNKIYKKGKLAEIRMPKAEIGFAIASHYLLMAEGTRTVTVEFTGAASFTGPGGEYKDDVSCLFTAKEGWFEGKVGKFKVEGGKLKLVITLSGADPAVVPYSVKIHKYGFQTNLPVLLVRLRHRNDFDFVYPHLSDLPIEKIDLTVDVGRLRSLALSNDFGPVDGSKPFEPYGAQPVKGSALIVGSKEVFQKNLTSASVNVKWLTPPNPYKTASPKVRIDFLKDGEWLESNIPENGAGSTKYDFTVNQGYSVKDQPDLTLNEHFNTTSRHGFARLRLTDDFGQDRYQADLLDYLRSGSSVAVPAKTPEIVNKKKMRDDSAPANPAPPPVGPAMGELWVDYKASQPIALDSAAAAKFDRRPAFFFHVAPFGLAERHPALNPEQKVRLLPRFDFLRDGVDKGSDAAELYIGVTGLKPPQSLALLFQVADGTADPLSAKPPSHIRWSYLKSNEWVFFDNYAVEDKTGGLLNPGIVTFAVPREASDANTLLPTGMHWLRGAVAEESDAVCRLRMVAAQALEATFADRGNDPAFPARALEPGTIAKLDRPDAAVKSISQPFASFGGRGKEESLAFYTRVSERLRHKERAIALWDYERLVLEAFPQIYKVKCQNHTQFEPDKKIYRELAPGHVTIITIPDQQSHNLRDPFRPFTSLGLLEEIKAFLKKRFSCFITPHVCNPEFEEVRVGFKVRLRNGFDESYYKNELNEVITRFLSPWAFPGGGNPSFGGKIHKSALINFIEDLPYVDYVTDFRLNLNDIPVDLDEVEGSKTVSILVSSRDHDLAVIHPVDVEPQGGKCGCEP